MFDSKIFLGRVWCFLPQLSVSYAIVDLILKLEYACLISRAGQKCKKNVWEGLEETRIATYAHHSSHTPQGRYNMWIWGWNTIYKKSYSILVFEK